MFSFFDGMVVAGEGPKGDRGPPPPCERGKRVAKSEGSGKTRDRKNRGKGLWVEQGLEPTLFCTKIDPTNLPEKSCEKDLKKELTPPWVLPRWGRGPTASTPPECPEPEGRVLPGCLTKGEVHREGEAQVVVEPTPRTRKRTASR